MVIALVADGEQKKRGSCKQETFIIFFINSRRKRLGGGGHVLSGSKQKIPAFEQQVNTSTRVSE